MNRTVKGTTFGGISLLFAVAILLPFRDKVNSTPIALTLLLVVLFTAAKYGTNPAIIISIASMLCFNFFFLHPYHTLNISDPENWIALIAFLITSLIAGSLSGRVKHRAEESERKQNEIQQLYSELQVMFKKASEADAIKQSEKLKSALLEAVTHDLRTPLTSMKAATTTLLTGDQSTLTSEVKQELLEVINTEIDRLNHHFEGLIEIAKIEAGAMEPRPTWSNIEEMISISLTRAAGLTSSHKIRVQHQQNLPLMRIDEKAISEVLYLLIENAAKYAPSQSEILIKVEPLEDMLKISVEDQGTGIPVELREKVFDKFFRYSVHPSIARARPAGLGMGLAISRAIVEAHGGRIWIEDTAAGKGIRICFTLPVVRSESKIEA